MRTTEEWRVINDAPDYAVSSSGRVKRITPDWQGKYNGRELKPSAHRRGYLGFVLCVNGKKITRKAHRLVCEAFNGPQPQGRPHCAHKDGDTSNNAPENLYWATAKQNAADRERHGRTARGEKNGMARHPESRITGDRHWTRTNPEKLARGNNHYAKRNPELVPLGSARHNSKLTEAQVQEILATPKTHGSGKMLASKFGVSMALITAIRKGRAWKQEARANRVDG